MSANGYRREARSNRLLSAVEIEESGEDTREAARSKLN